MNFLAIAFLDKPYHLIHYNILKKFKVENYHTFYINSNEKIITPPFTKTYLYPFWNFYSKGVNNYENIRN